MKTLKITFLALVLLGTKAFADGSGAHGGDAVHLKDDRIVLADSFLKSNHGDQDHTGGGVRFKIYPELRSELGLISSILGSYGCKESSSKAQNQRFTCEFIEKEVLNDQETEYYLVKSFAQTECFNGADYKIPAGAKLLPGAACTVGGRTYLKGAIFSQMSVREQAKLLVHERLRALPKAPFLKDIATFTTALDLSLELYYQQSLGKFRDLSAPEIDRLNLLIKQLGDFRLNSNHQQTDKKFSVSTHGGGMVDSRLENAPGAYVSVNSYLDGHMILDNGVVIFNTKLACAYESYDSSTCHLEKGAKIISSELELGYSSIGQMAKIVDSYMVVGSGISMQTQSEIVRFKTGSEGLMTLFLGPGSSLQDSELHEIRRNKMVPWRYGDIMEDHTGFDLGKNASVRFLRGIVTPVDSSEDEHMSVRHEVLRITEGAQISGDENHPIVCGMAPQNHYGTPVFQIGNKEISSNEALLNRCGINRH